MSEIVVRLQASTIPRTRPIQTCATILFAFWKQQTNRFLLSSETQLEVLWAVISTEELIFVNQLNQDKSKLRMMVNGKKFDHTPTTYASLLVFKFIFLSQSTKLKIFPYYITKHIKLTDFSHLNSVKLFKDIKQIKKYLKWIFLPHFFDSMTIWTVIIKKFLLMVDCFGFFFISTSIWGEKFKIIS